MKFFSLLIICSFFSCKTEQIQAQPPNQSIKYAFNIPKLTLTDYDNYKLKYLVDYDFTFGGDYDGFNDPEEVLLVHVSLVDEGWLPNLYFTKEDAPKVPIDVIVQRRRNIDYREKNFYELQHKFSFIHTGKEINVIVVHEYQDNNFSERKHFVITKDEQDKYKVLTQYEGELKQLTDFFAYIKPNVLDILQKQYIFKTNEEVMVFLEGMREERLNKLKSDYLFPANDNLITEIYDQTRTELNKFSLNKFFLLVEKWKKEGNTNKLNYVYSSMKF